MEPYPQESDDYDYEHDVKMIIEESEEGTHVMGVYDQETKTWEVIINYGDYIFNGQVSPEGVPTNGVISYEDEDMYFNNNKKLSPKGFAHTIMCIFQYKMNEKIQKYYKKKKKDGKDKKKKKDGKAYTASRYIDDRDIIKEEDNENSGEEEGNAIQENTINEHPTQPTQQPQNQSNLNLKSGQNQQPGLGGNK